MKRIWFLVAGVVLVLGIGAGLVFGLGGGKPKTYTVEITSNVDQIEYESKNNCRLGDNITIEAIPLDGYRFIGWEVNGVIVSEDPRYEIALTQENVNNVYRAMYKQIFNIYTGEVQNGGVSANVTKAIEGETITLTITPNDHYAFENAYYILDSETEHVAITNQTFTMPNGNVTVYANFQEIEYSITSAELEHGTLSFLPTVGTYGIEIVVTVTPDTGYELTPNSLHYTTENIANGEIAYTNGTYSFIMPGEDVIVHASFYRTTFNVTVPSTQTGYTIKNTNNNAFTTNSVQYGDSVSFKVVLNTGYNGTPVVRNNNDLLTPNNDVYTISNVTSDVNITIEGIAANEYALTFPEDVTVTRNNVQLTSGATIYYGDTLTLSPTTAPSEEMTSVYSVNGTEITGNTITVTDNVTITYSEKERVKSASEYETLVFESYDSSKKTVLVKANADCKPGGDLVIPAYVINDEDNKTYKVQKIQTDGFKNCSGLTSVTIKNVVQEIKHQAFEGCSNLRSVTFESGSNLKTIGNKVFKNCTSLTGIVIPNKVTRMGYIENSSSNNPFAGCTNLITLDFEEGSAYSNDYIFTLNQQLENITIPGAIQGEVSSYGITNLKRVIIQEGVTSIGSSAFYNCSSLTSITIPNSVTSVGSSAFSYCSSLTSVNIPSGVTSIGNSAFYGCSNLTNVTIPNGVTSIGNYTFYNCSSLTSVTIASIDSWLNISFGDETSNPLLYAHHLYIGDNEITELIIPEGIMEIKNYTFDGCSSLINVTIPSGVTSIGEDAFRNCSSLTSVTIPNSVTSMGSSAFSGCSSLTSVIIPSGITSIGDYTFKGCSSLTSITIPNSVTSIGYQSFFGCSSLTSITIPNDVTSISAGTFSGCRSLENITLPFVGGSVKTATDTYQYPLGHIFGTSSYTGSRSVIQYFFGSSTSTATSAYYYIPSSLRSVTITGGNILYGAFYGCSMLTSVTIPNSVTSIGSSAFRDCSSLTSITIPNSVTSIGSSAFRDCSSLTSITIPNSVTSIGSHAFYNCSSLTSVTIGSGVTSIGERAFYGCSSLTSVTIGSGVTSIGTGAFSGCSKLYIVNNLSQLNITAGNSNYGYVANYAHLVVNDENFSLDKLEEIDGVMYYKQSPTSKIAVGLVDTTKTSITLIENTTEICYKAFYYCSSLTSITIPNSVTNIGESAFGYCSSLESMILPFVGGSVKTETDTYQYPLGYIFGTTSYTGGTSVTQYYYGSSTSSTTNTTYYIPSSLRSVTITGGNILYGAFYGCSMLTSVTIPDSVTSIGSSAFDSCSSLTSITIPNSVTSIGHYAFYYCSSLTSVTIPNGVTSIGSSAFSGCGSLTSVTIGSGVTSIGGSNAFKNCYALAEVYNKSALNITKGSDSYGYVALYAEVVYSGDTINTPTKIEEIDGVKYYKESDTSYIALKCIDKTKTAISLDSRTTEIRQYAFYGCSSLTTITMPNSVTSIGSSAFSGCSSLTSVTIGSGVTSIGSGAFYGCSSLNSVTIENIESWLNISFVDSSSNPLCYVHHLYIGNNEVTELVIPEGTTEIKGYAFYNCDCITSVVIPDSITSMGERAFRNCSSLTSVTIGSGVTSIGDSAFSMCSSLTSITIPNSVTSIGISAFYGCSSLTSVTIGSGVTSIGYRAFYDCSSLTSVTIGSGVTSIGQSAFYNCGSLTMVTIENIESWLNISFVDSSSNPLLNAHYLYIGNNEVTELIIPEGITEIKNYAFYNCSSLTSVSIPESVTSIGQYAFYNCSSLTNVSIPDSVTSIGSGVFQYCSGLTSVTIPESVTSIGDSVFSNCSSLTSVTIGSGVTSIGSNAFSGCRSLTNVTIPNSVTSIGSSAFSGCYALAEVYNKSALNITKGSDSYGYVALYAEVVYSGDEINTPSKIEEIDGVKYYKESDTSYIALRCIDKTKTTIGLDSRTIKIRQYAFYDCGNLTSVTIPNSVTSIGEYAFSGCSSLTSIAIPNGVTSIGSSAFYNCSSLTNVTIENIESWLNISFGSYGSNPLYYAHHLYIGNNEVTELIISEGITEIKDYAFYNCNSLTSITIPNSVTSIGRYVFSGCSSLTSVTIPNSVTSIGEYAFEYCSSLTSVTIGSGVTSIGSSAFYSCYALAEIYNKSALIITKGSSDYGYVAYYAEVVYSGDEINTPTKIEGIDGVAYYKESDTSYIALRCIDKTKSTISLDSRTTKISQYAFYYCSSLTSVTIPNNVTSIGERAFSGCSSLTSVTIPNNVTSIGNYAFSGCYALAEVYNKSSLNITKGSDSYGYVAYYAEVVYSGSTIDTASKIEIIDGVAYYKESETSYIALVCLDKTKTTISLDSRTTKIKDYAFSNCSSLTSVTMPNSVTSIGDRAFYGCSSLTSLTIPGGVTRIGNYAFYGCSSLTSVIIPSSVTSIGNYAFYNCSSLTSVTIPNGVTSIGNSAFFGCSSLISVTIPNNVTSIGSNAFYDCSNLTNVTFENPNGWFVANSSTATSGTDVTLTNSETNATYLKSTYSGKIWKRNS